MQKFVRFWKKDLINKFIMLVAFLILLAIAVELFLLLKPGKSGFSLASGLFPTPTLELKVILTRRAATVQYEVAMMTASVPPTMTTMPLTPRVKTSTPTPGETAPAPLISPTPTLLSPTPVPTIGPLEARACIPDNQRQSGKVVSILDGSTIKVLMKDGLVYQVRYLGVQIPEEKAYSQLAEAKNAELVFLKDIILVGDDPDKDSLGRLYRYVITEDKFVNFELIKQGYAYADQTATSSSCAQVFKNAEDAAKAAKNGIWK